MNRVHMVGNLDSGFIYSNTYKGKRYYTSLINIKRLSGTVDRIPVMISEEDLDRVIHNRRVELFGKCFSYNFEGHLKVYIFIEDIEPTNLKKDINEISFEGTICNKPKSRLTPFGKCITDLMLAITRDQNKTDFIPCILWGKNKFVEKGETKYVEGRMQSREYQKIINGERNIFTTYEVSICN